MIRRPTCRGRGRMNDKNCFHAAAALARAGAAVVLLSSLLAGCGPMTAKDWAHTGYSRLEAGDYQGSMEAYSKSIELEPTHAVAYENRGVAYSRLGDQEAALADFKKALSMHDPKVPLRDTYREMGVAYYRMGRTDDAVASWQKGLNKAPGDASLLNNLAVAYMNRKQYDEAESAAQKAAAADPKMPEALNTLGELSMIRKEYAAAADYFVRAIKRDPEKASRYWNAAMAFEKLKKYDKALEYATGYTDRETDPAWRQRGQEYVERLKRLKDRRATEGEDVI